MPAPTSMSRNRREYSSVATRGHRAPPRNVFAQIFTEDPGLAGPVGDATRDRLSTIYARIEHVADKTWEPSPRLRERASLGLLVLDGLLVRRIGVLGREACELLGPRDLIRGACCEVDEYASIPQVASMEVILPTTLAVLDERLRRDASRWCRIESVVADRISRRNRDIMVQLTAARLPSSAARLLIVLWHLADRWGRWRDGHILIPLPLTHSLLANLISVRREQVSRTALPRLVAQDLVSRDREGFYLLHGEPPDNLEHLTNSGREH